MTGPTAAFLRRVAAQRGVRGALVLLALLYAVALLAPFVAPCDPTRPSDADSHHPPNVGFVDGAGRIRARPWVVATTRATDADGRRALVARVEGGAPLAWFVRGDAWEVDLPFLPALRGDLHLFGAAPGGPRPFVMGADQRGRDLFARVVHGARVSLTIGVLGALVSLAIGMLVGGVAGCAGGRVDALLMRACEVLLLLPGFYVLLALRGALPDTTAWSSTQVYGAVVVIVSALWWAGTARTIRGQILSERRREHVLAARALGASGWRVLVRHLLPATAATATVTASLSIPGCILMESSLSVLGLGIQEPEPSWGNLLAEATRVAQLEDHPWILLPGLVLCAAVAAFQRVADGLRTALEPGGHPRAAMASSLLEVPPGSPPPPAGRRAAEGHGR